MTVSDLCLSYFNSFEFKYDFLVQQNTGGKLVSIYYGDLGDLRCKSWNDAKDLEVKNWMFDRKFNRFVVIAK